MITAVILLKNIIFSMILIGVVLFFSACSFFSSDEDIKKNKNIQVELPAAPYEEVDVTSADRVWQNKKNGNTIAYNSACKEAFKKETLDTLEQNILSGVDEIKVLSKEKANIDGSTGERTRAEGQVDNVKVIIELVTYKKGDCAFDLAYIGRVLSFPKDWVTFDHFVSRFHTL